jgi:hypothetical protein
MTLNIKSGKYTKNKKLCLIFIIESLIILLIQPRRKDKEKHIKSSFTRPISKETISFVTTGGSPKNPKKKNKKIRNLEEDLKNYSTNRSIFNSLEECKSSDEDVNNPESLEVNKKEKKISYIKKTYLEDKPYIDHGNNYSSTNTPPSFDNSNAFRSERTTYRGSTTNFSNNNNNNRSGGDNNPNRQIFEDRTSGGDYSINVNRQVPRGILVLAQDYPIIPLAIAGFGLHYIARERRSVITPNMFFNRTSIFPNNEIYTRFAEASSRSFMGIVNFFASSGGPSDPNIEFFDRFTRAPFIDDIFYRDTSDPMLRNQLVAYNNSEDNLEINPL